MNESTEASAVDNVIYLTGRPPLARFVRFMRAKSLDGLRLSEGELAEQWRQGREIYRQLEIDERNWADNIRVDPLPAEMRELAELGLQQPSIQRLKHFAPRQWGLVEVDRLVIFQPTINLRFVEEIKATIRGTLTPEEVMRVAVGNVQQRRPHVRALQSGDDTYSFASASNDLRFLDVVNLPPESITGFQPSGSASNAIVIFVGFSDNLISGVQAGGRIFLTNGSHRVYALRELGVTHVPCLLTMPSREEEYELVLPSDVKQDREQYVRHPRPSVFKDYFDSRIFRTFQVMRMNHVLEAKLNLNKTGVPAMY